METTDIEKKNLEAHVDLCAQRYKFLEAKLEDVDTKMTNLETVVREVHDMVQAMSQKNTDRLINWGIGIIAVLLSITGWLITHYVLK